MIKGITVTLWTKTRVGTDSLNQPIYEWDPEEVDNVLVAQPTAQEQLDEFNLTGRSIEYILGIPKGDTHSWENERVEFFGQMFQTFGIPERGIEANVPGPWHLKVKCQRFN